ncbi:hypothetical protein PAHAL_8G107000 [Panicum hallii]|jgi:hypothetical protein|uniref:Uncharacterized protein n=1 Tax=Panicum hallii TaxID=206008 RepID=A0A2S3IDY6_9POAL|nr:hypothetical protein PAHAL_8G107000 [Panicum hallii]
MVLGLCSCFGVAPAAETGKKPASEQQLAAAGDEEKKKHQAAGDQETAGGEAGGPKTMAVDRSMVVTDKRAQTPVVMHQFPFHSRPGLL